MKYLYAPNNKHFLCRDLFNITFALYNILKLKAYLFGLLDKDSCNSTNIKTEQFHVLYPWITGS